MKKMQRVWYLLELRQLHRKREWKQLTGHHPHHPHPLHHHPDSHLTHRKLRGPTLWAGALDRLMESVGLMSLMRWAMEGQSNWRTMKVDRHRCQQQQRWRHLQRLPRLFQIAYCHAKEEQQQQGALPGA